MYTPLIGQYWRHRLGASSLTLLSKSVSHSFPRRRGDLPIPKAASEWPAIPPEARDDCFSATGQYRIQPEISRIRVSAYNDEVAHAANPPKRLVFRRRTGVCRFFD